jgi:hypothetical protein
MNFVSFLPEDERKHVCGIALIIANQNAERFACRTAVAGRHDLKGSLGSHAGLFG